MNHEMPEAARREARITTPAPFDLFISYRDAEPTPLNWLKAARAAMVWRAHAGLGSLAIAGRLLGWFYRFPSDLLRYMWRCSATWKRHFHRTRLQQFLDIVAAAAGNGLMPRDYYRCDIAKKGRGEGFFDVIPYQLYATPLEVLAHERSAIRRRPSPFSPRTLFACAMSLRPTAPATTASGGQADGTHAGSGSDGDA